MKRRHSLNGKRLYFLTVEASSDEIRRLRGLLELEGIHLINERHRALNVHLLYPFLLIPAIILYMLNVVPDAFSLWYPLAMLVVGREALEMV